MNERIRELALEAGFDFDIHGSNDGNFYGWEGRWINQDIAQLAKLIASDCANICQDNEQLSAAIRARYGC